MIFQDSIVYQNTSYLFFNSLVESLIFFVKSGVLNCML